MKSDIICVQHSDTQQSKREREKQKTTTTTTTEQKSNNNNIKNITSTVETAKNYMWEIKNVLSDFCNNI